MDKIKDEGYIISLHEYKSTRTHWIALYVNGDNIIYLDNFGVEYIPKKTRKIKTKTSQKMCIEYK